MTQNHAFLIVAHDYPEQLAEIVHLLDAPNHFFFIHIDKKNAVRMMESPGVMKLKRRRNCNITHCVSVNWGGGTRRYKPLYVYYRWLLMQQ